MINRPFVIHLWDILDGSPPNASSDLRWLLQRAEHVFCVSKPLFDEAAAFNASVSYLLFQRSASRHFAKPPDRTETFRIALIGHLNSYQDGLDLLVAAIHQLNREGTHTEVIYIGPKDGLHLISPHLRQAIASTGFLSSDRRDAILSSCHAGFLPGPLKPQTGRSKYSIPSRLLDYFAVALPVIATVHPGSATAGFLAPIAGKGAFLLEQKEEICALVQALRRRSYWQEASDRSLGFGAEFEASANNQQLADYFKNRTLSY
jgi:glycosyltransferase involved in cell wall biosynthesis